jgi:hypothetical protein
MRLSRWRFLASTGWALAQTGPSLSGVSAQSLAVGDTSERKLFRITEVFRDLSIEQAEFLKQRRVAVLRKSLQEVLDHGSQPPYDLQIVRAARSDFAESKMDKVLPIGCPKNHADFAQLVQDFVGTQIALATARSMR